MGLYARDEIEKLKREEVLAFSCLDTIRLVESMEQHLFSEDATLHNTREFCESCRSHVNDIHGRITQRDEESKSWSSRKTKLLEQKLGFLRVGISVIIQSYRLQDNVTEALVGTKTAFNNKVEETKGELDSKVIETKHELDEKVKQTNEGVDKKVNEAERGMITHVLTLMGVFTSIIVVIMSVIITSTSWLNNADGTSAILAFVVPTSVTVIAVIVLLLMVFCYRYAVSSTEKDIRSACAVLCMFLVLVIGLAATYGLVKSFSEYWYVKKCEPSHIHLVIPESQYNIASGKDGFLYFEITVDGAIQRVIYNENLLDDKDGSLRYCKVCNALE